jgi:type II secretory pathway pseudopilin PulG
MRGHGAFTLLELLVAVTITLLLAAAMLAVTAGTLNLWRRAQDNSALGAQARLALDMLERDLQGGLHRKDALGTTWLAADVLNNPASLSNHGWQTATLRKPVGVESQRLVPVTTNGLSPSIADARFGLSGVWLRFIGTNADAEGSVPVAVSYQVARRAVSGSYGGTNPADIRYSLFRSVVGAARTFNAGYSITAAAYDNATPGYGSSTFPGAVTSPAVADVLSTNVVDFGVWLYVRHADGALRRIYPANNTDLAHAATDATTPGDDNRYPEVADVMVRVLTDEGARILDAMEKSNGTITRPANYVNDAEWWWGVVAANSRVFTRRVEVKGRAP